jgi:hypothetical protein
MTSVSKKNALTTVDPNAKSGSPHHRADEFKIGMG